MLIEQQRVAVGIRDLEVRGTCGRHVRCGRYRDAARLQGALQDEHGVALTPELIAATREELAAAAAEQADPPL